MALYPLNSHLIIIWAYRMDIKFRISPRHYVESIIEVSVNMNGPDELQQMDK